MFQDKVVVITGAAHGIGKCAREMFEAEGAKVSIIDIVENDSYVGDISKKEVLEDYAKHVIQTYGHVDVLVNNALPSMKGIHSCSYEEFMNALQVGIAAPFYLSQLLIPYMPKGSSIINISSTRSQMSEAETESYSAAKGGIYALTHSMAMSLRGQVRVNAIAPGWIDTHGNTYEGSDASQHPVNRVGVPEDIANMILYLASDKASFITGQELIIDGGMSKQMIYHGDGGWIYEE